MNINPSQCLRTASSFFFIFILLFGGMARASIFHRMIRSPLPDISQSKIKEVFDVLEDLDIEQWEIDVSESNLRALVRALDDPTHLIKNTPHPGSSFGLVHSSAINTRIRFFFARFDLYKDSDSLFTKLFAKKSGSELQELPFEETKRNWENFLDTVKNANNGGYAQITEIDLEAAAMSFIHQRFPDKYFPDMDLVSRTHPRFWIRSWEEQSLGTFFHNQFNIGHYTNPHFTLNWNNHYYILIMNMIWDPSFLKEGENLSLVNTKEFVLKIWNDVTKEISIGRVTTGTSNFVFLERIVESIIEFRNLSGSSAFIESQPFLKALVEAAREDDRLTQLVDIVNKLASNTNTPEDYRWRILQQFIKASGLEEDMVHSVLSSHGLLDENFALRSQMRQSDPADAGANL